ncbi:PilZ domain-containing protein [Aestuariirhabdus sp. Z084]|uniref:PilZ domain-containing protein n=1 Tax=Aestuariirhabdus haliotis TaxID=2918751 RepID=UPI00201B383C|nr:PilZ domain-containing protein [Aestuariirhabdus haliotis]MCL6417554.1 PilZ domain-containing protein [Aestuariirhabdus haliotis]MCL6421491.1 PilZ domain-containing protein [Aestuariirhabdus haliotis]
MQERRDLTRHYLSDYLTVYNSNTGREIGALGNISDGGLMLITRLPVMVGEMFKMSIKLPQGDGEYIELKFDATSQWCRQDVDPAYYDTGFSIETSSDGMQDLILTLKEYFTFRTPGS